MWQDPIVEEIRRIRDEHAKRFNDDLHAICEDFRKMQSSSGRTVVFRQPRWPAIPVVQKSAPAPADASASLRQGRGRA